MVSDGRWKAAQEYEAGFWHRMAGQIAQGSAAQLEWYGWRADQLTKRLRSVGLDALASGSAAIVEVGGGPIGVATYFPGARRVAVDPLNDVYNADPVLVKLRSPDVEYLTGVGEALPVDGDGFDLAIIENCIDHVRDAHGVMRELRRVLKPGGTLYLMVNCRSQMGYYVHRMLSRLRIDRGHPHTFTPERARALVTAFGFDVFDFWEWGTYRESRAADLKSGSPRERLKGYLGVSEFPIALLARRRAASAP